VTPDIEELPTDPGDLFLLCSDGLTKEVPEPRIAEVLHDVSAGSQIDAQTLCQRLIEAANAAGGSDNITAILVRVG
jgi:protein phosphatase